MRRSVLGTLLAVAGAALCGVGCSSEEDGSAGAPTSMQGGNGTAGASAGGNGTAGTGVAGSSGGAAAGGSSSGGGETGGGGGGTAGEGCGSVGPLVGLPYPERDAYHMKGIQPDFWPNKQELIDHAIGSISINMVWAHWEAQPKSAPCSGEEQEYDGRCYDIDPAVDAAIADWTDRGIVVVGIVYGVPAWARVGNTGCSPIAAGFDIFCTPDDPAEYGRFAGMLASRYDGTKGHGRIADFVVHNEVNTNAWFDIGCGQGVPCDATTWIETYADNYVAAYDAIKQHQSEAKVLLSFEHAFDTDFDRPADVNAMLSVKTFITELDALVGDRRWQLGYHPYALDLMSNQFSVLDLPAVTYGNIGVLLGWLRATFPTKACAWEVQLTESGVNSTAPSSEAAQGPAICDGFRNILGTPGIHSYVYHRMQDVASEAPLHLGLVRENGSYKPAWATWAWANHTDADHPVMTCGFENLPYTRLTLYRSDEWHGMHWASSRLPPADFSEQAHWYLSREPAPNSELLFECMVDSGLVGPSTFLSTDLACDDAQLMGPVGYLWTSQVNGTEPLYQCARQVALATDSFLSADAACEGQGAGSLLGYARPSL